MTSKIFCSLDFHEANKIITFIPIITGSGYLYLNNAVLVFFPEPPKEKTNSKMVQELTFTPRFF